MTSAIDPSTLDVKQGVFLDLVIGVLRNPHGLRMPRGESPVDHRAFRLVCHVARGLAEEGVLVILKHTDDELAVARGPALDNYAVTSATPADGAGFLTIT